MKSKEAKDTAKPFGELYVDTNGEPHFICHTSNDDFESTKAILIQFVELLQDKIDREDECPFKER